MKRLWTEEETAFEGDFCSFPSLRSYPKPAQTPYPPIIFGGEGDPALRRVGEAGNGWFGMNVSVADAKPKIDKIKEFAKAAGRDPEAFEFSVSPGAGVSPTKDDLKGFQDAGVHQVIVWPSSADLQAVKDDIDKLGDEVVAPAASL